MLLQRKSVAFVAPSGEKYLVYNIILRSRAQSCVAARCCAQCERSIWRLQKFMSCAQWRSRRKRSVGTVGIFSSSSQRNRISKICGPPGLHYWTAVVSAIFLDGKSARPLLNVIRAPAVLLQLYSANINASRLVIAFLGERYYVTFGLRVMSRPSVVCRL